MEDNKLIAEFMGEPYYYADEERYYYADDEGMEFHTSWDWLMPVAEKCLTTGEGKIIYHGSRQHYVINDALLTCNIEEVYKVVVEFIKQYNDEKRS